MNFFCECQEAAACRTAVIYSGRHSQRLVIAMRFVGSDEIRRTLTFPILVAAMEASHRGRRMEINDMLMGEEKALYFARSAADHGRAFGSKVFTSFPGNLTAGKGLPAVQAVYVLFSGTDGRSLAVLDGTEITWWKTAADSALGAKLLAPALPETLVVVGAGAIAPWLARAHLSVRPSIRRVLVWNRTSERAETVARGLRDEGIAAVATADLEVAVRQADVVTSVTRSHV